MPQAVAGGDCETDKLAAFPVGIQLVGKTFASDGGVIGVGDDQPALIRHQIDRETRGHREIEPLAEPQVFLPFPVAAEIGNCAFDLDDNEFAVAVDRHDIDPPAIRQLEFG